MVCGDGVGRWVLEKAGGVPTPEMTALARAGKDGELKAGVAYDMYTGPGGSISMHSRIDSPHYCTATFLHHVFTYPFRQLRVRRVFGIVDARKEEVIRFNLKLGFRVDGELRDFFPEGKAVVMGMGEGDCRWLGVIPRY